MIQEILALIVILSMVVWSFNVAVHWLTRQFQNRPKPTKPSEEEIRAFRDEVHKMNKDS